MISRDDASVPRSTGRDPSRDPSRVPERSVGLDPLPDAPQTTTRDDDGDARGDGCDRDDVGVGVDGDDDEARSSCLLSTRASSRDDGDVARVEGRRTRDDGGCHRRARRDERRALARRTVPIEAEGTPGE